MALSNIMALFEGDFGGVKEAEQVRKLAKSPEEIARLAVDEAVPDSERAGVILRRGQTSQRAAVLAAAAWFVDPLIMGGGTEGAMAALGSALVSALARGDECPEERDAALAGIEGLMCAAAARRLPPGALARDVAPLLTSAVMRLEGGEPLARVAGALVEAARLLPPEEARAALPALAARVGDVSNPPERRALAGRLVGAALGARSLTGGDLSPGLWELLLNLCQDTEAVVRRALVEQLALLYVAAPDETLRGRIVEELLALLDDEELAVRVDAVRTLVALVRQVPRAVRREALLPRLRAQYAAARGVGLLADGMRTVLGESVGALLLALVDAGEAVPVCGEIADTPVPSGDAGAVLAVLEFHASLGSHSRVEYRKLCAYNLPAVAAIVGPPLRVSHVVPLVCRLALDGSELVRRTLACGLHEVAARLGGELTVTQLRGAFVALFQDEADHVVSALIDSMRAWLPLFCVDDIAVRTGALAAITPLVLAVAKRRCVALSWRRQVRLLAALRLLPLMTDSEAATRGLLDAVDAAFEGGARPVRAAAVRSMMWIARHAPSGLYRQTMLAGVLSLELVCRGREAWRRALFPEAVGAAVWIFSRAFVKAQLIDPLLSLVKDPVIDVRRAALDAVPRLRPWLVFPKDAEVIQRIQLATKEAADADGDPGVRACAAAALARLHEVEERLAACGDGAARGGGGGGGAGGSGGGGGPAVESPRMSRVGVEEDGALAANAFDVNPFALDSLWAPGDAAVAAACARMQCVFPRVAAGATGLRGPPTHGAHSDAEERDRTAKEEALASDAQREADAEARRVMEERREARTKEPTCKQRMNAWQYRHQLKNLATARPGAAQLGLAASGGVAPAAGAATAVAGRGTGALVPIAAPAAAGVAAGGSGAGDGGSGAARKRPPGLGSVAGVRTGGATSLKLPDLVPPGIGGGGGGVGDSPAARRASAGLSSSARAVAARPAAPAPSRVSVPSGATASAGARGLLPKGAPASSSGGVSTPDGGPSRRVPGPSVAPALGAPSPLISVRKR